MKVFIYLLVVCLPLAFSFSNSFAFNPAPYNTAVLSYDDCSPNNAGASAAGIGDVDDDGFEDYAVGNPCKNSGATDEVGEVIIYSGLSGSVLTKLLGDRIIDESHFGERIIGLGDLDGDGRGDFAISEPGYSDIGPPLMFKSGRIQVISGATFQPIYELFGGGVGGLLGEELNVLGDLNGDGKLDFGATEKNQVGAIIYSGADGSVLFNFTGGVDRIADGGDINNDGTPDVLIATTVFPGPFPSFGVYNVISGLTFQPIYTEEGPNDICGRKLGDKLGPLGDVNNDGHADYFVGEASVLPSSGSGCSGLANTRRLQVRSGIDHSVIYSFTGISQDTGIFPFGFSRLDDLGTDGIPDFAIGFDIAARPLAVGSTDMVKIFSGSTGQEFITLERDNVARFGDKIFDIGDVDTDGIRDFSVVGIDFSNEDQKQTIYTLTRLNSFIDTPQPPFTTVDTAIFPVNIDIEEASGAVVNRHIGNLFVDKCIKPDPVLIFDWFLISEFIFNPGYEYLDGRYEIRNINTVQSYSEEGVQQTVDPIVGPTPAIDPEAGFMDVDFPGLESINPFYFFDEALDIFKKPFSSLKFEDGPENDKDSVINFRTYVVARDKTIVPPRTEPKKEFQIVAGYTWKHFKNTDQVFIGKRIEADRFAIETEYINTAFKKGLSGTSTASGSASPGYPGWSATPVIPLNPTPALVSKIDTVSLAAGGTQNFTLYAGAEHALQLYLILGSASGTEPGVDAGPINVPLNFDFITGLMFQLANEQPFFINTVGLLNPFGNFFGTIINYPVNLNLQTMELNYAGLILDASTSPLLLDVTNPLSVLIIP